MKKVVVVGAGFGGLAVSALLAKKGFDVTLLEKNAEVGGRARVWLESGFSFDMGPSWYLMPEVFERFFSELDTKPSDLYSLVRLDPMYKVFHSTGDLLEMPARAGKIMEVFSNMEKDGHRKLKEYLALAEYQYDIAMEDFIYKEYERLSDFFTPALMTKGLKLHVFDKLDSRVRKFFSNELLVKILEYPVVFLGGDPKNTPALYSIMSYVDLKLGVWYPMGGLGAVVSAIRGVAEKNGVKIFTGQDVRKIEADRVVSSRAVFEADIFVVNADYPYSETNLLDKKHRTYPEKYWEKKTLAPSAFLIYLGIDKKLEGLRHHNLYFEENWFNHFDSIFRQPKWPEKPSYYVSCPSKTDPSVAPEGCENLFILVPVAPGLKDSDELREKYYLKIVSHLERLLGEDILSHVVFRKIFSQRDFIGEYNAYRGTALGLSHTLFQTAYFRPRHRSKKQSNHYYVGQYTHPGIGVPMSIISAQIVAGEVAKDHGT